MVTTVDFRDELYERAKTIAAKEQISLKRIMNKALAAYLQKAEKKEKK